MRTAYVCPLVKKGFSINIFTSNVRVPLISSSIYKS